MVKYVNTNEAFDSSVPFFKELSCQNIMVNSIPLCVCVGQVKNNITWQFSTIFSHYTGSG